MAAIRNVAVIGLGIMGGAIARNLVATGFRVSGFDIDRGRAAAAALCTATSKLATNFMRLPLPKAPR